MPVSSSNSRDTYTGSGTTGPFAYTFRIFEDSDLRATIADADGLETTLTLDVDYTITGAGSFSGGNVTLTEALAVGETLTLRRVLAATNDTDLPNQGGYYPDVVEAAIDRLTMLVQQVIDETDRSLRLPETEEGSDTTTILPPLADRKGRNLYFDETTGQPGAGSSILGTTVSSVMEAVVSAVTRQVAMNLLAGGTTANRVLRADGTNVSLGQVALADMASMTDARLLGRSAGSAGIPQEVAIGDGLSLASGTLSASLAFWGRILNGTAVAHTGAGTLTVDRMNTVNLTVADATLSLPAAASNSGKVIGIKVLSTNTKCATIDGNASETIDGSTTVQMHKNGILLIASDGTGWYSLVRNLAPGVYVKASSNASQTVTADTEPVEYEDEAYDSHAAWDGSTFTAPVAGLYEIEATCGIVATTTGLHLYARTGSSDHYGPGRTSTANSAAYVSVVWPLPQGTQVTIRLSGTEARTAGAEKNELIITRVGDYVEP